MEIKKIGIIIGSIGPNIPEKQVTQNLSEPKVEPVEIKPEVHNENKEAK
jgi:hypothetical protein